MTKRRIDDVVDRETPRLAKRADTRTRNFNHCVGNSDGDEMVIRFSTQEQEHASVVVAQPCASSSSSSSSPNSATSTETTMSICDLDSDHLAIHLLGDLLTLKCNVNEVDVSTESVSTTEVSSAPAPQHTNVKPLGDRVLVKIKDVDENAQGGILLASTAKSKTQGGEVVAVGEGKIVGKNKVDISVKAGEQVVYSKYAGTEVEFNGSKHLIMKDGDIIGILETEEVKDLKPLNDRVLIKVAEAEEKTVGGLLLTEATKDKPSIGTVIAVGPGSVDDEGNRKPLSISPGNTVLYSKYAGNDFKGKDGSDYIALRASDVMAILS